MNRCEKFEILEERPVAGALRRCLSIERHILGLIFGAGYAYLRQRRERGEAFGIKLGLLYLMSIVARVFLQKELLGAPFPVQFRRRLEMLGPTYIKLGQILSLREDILPTAVTDELKKLLDELPVVSFDRYRQLIEAELQRPLNSMFSWVDPVPLGSASLAQVHRARLWSGEEVVLKVIKPGIRETIERDTKLLHWIGKLLQVFLPHYQPRLVIQEFCHYTLRELDLKIEADNAEIFAANFRDDPAIVFPRVYREFSNSNILCMEYLAGDKPDAASSLRLTKKQKSNLIDIGARAIIRMIYQHGFFHADLHPGNLLIIGDSRAGFIDLGMVGRFDEDIRKSMFYYFYSLILGDAAGAARFLTSAALIDRYSDPEGFRREVEVLSLRWTRTPKFHEFSIGRLIMESIALCGRYRMYFPVEMILMVKALITYEGVGNMLDPEFDAVAVSQKHVRRVLLAQFHLLDMAKVALRSAPHVIDMLLRSPMVLCNGFRILEKNFKTPMRIAGDPLTGIRGTVLAGFCIVAGAILACFGGPWPAYALLFVLALVAIGRW